MPRRKKTPFQKQVRESIREVIFGLEDGLVSTLGAVTGIAAGAQSTFVVILSGLVLIGVESLSMAAGSYLSSKAVGESSAASRGKKSKHIHPIRGAFVMGFFYFLGGLIPISPYFFTAVDIAFLPSILMTGFTLFLIGVWSSHYTKRSAIKSGVEMVVISLAAAGLGYAIGRFIGLYFGVEVV